MTKYKVEEKTKTVFVGANSKEFSTKVDAVESLVIAFFSEEIGVGYTYPLIDTLLDKVDETIEILTFYKESLKE